MKIDSYEIGNGNFPYLIAEIGINHNGQLDEALKLLKAAKASGANAVKLQVFKADEFLSKTSVYFEIFEKLSFSFDDYKELFSTANDVGISIFGSVFDETAVDYMEKLNCPAYKIASGDITHIPLLKYVSETGKPVIISTGGATYEECWTALEAVKTQNESTNVALLHCVSNYPASFDELNLSTINEMKEIFQVPVGFSDHTIGSSIPIAAAALGADIIEKHFTLDTEASGPDHSLSANPNVLLTISEGIKNSHMAIGNSAKKPVETQEQINNIRRNITARKNIPKGTIITPEFISYKRPFVGLSPSNIDNIIGKAALVDIEEDSAITLDFLS